MARASIRPRSAGPLRRPTARCRCGDEARAGGPPHAGAAGAGPAGGAAGGACALAPADRRRRDVALNERRLVIGWLFRGTLHLVAREDYGWLLALTARTQRRNVERRLAQLGYQGARSDRAVRVIDQALEDGPQTRAALRERLARRGLDGDGQALVHLLFRSALNGTSVRGPLAGGAQTFVLCRDWLGRCRRRSYRARPGHGRWPSWRAATFAGAARRRRSTWPGGRGCRWRMRGLGSRPSPANCATWAMATPSWRGRAARAVAAGTAAGCVRRVRAELARPRLLGAGAAASAGARRRLDPAGGPGRRPRRRRLEGAPQRPPARARDRLLAATGAARCRDAGCRGRRCGPVRGR